MTDRMLTARELVAGLGGKWTGKSGMARCPAHDDRNPSLSVSDGKNGELLVHCHAGCTQAAVIDALKRRELWPDGARPGNRAEKRAGSCEKARTPGTTIFEYRDETGRVRFEVVREDRSDGSKKIYHRRRDSSGGVVNNLDGVELVPYRLPELIKGIEAGETIFIPEGEVKVGLLVRWGLVATCNAGGARKWRAEYTQPFKRRKVDVIILPDADTPGRAHANEVAANLFPVAASIKVVELPGLARGEDVIDWVARGGTKEMLLALVAAAPAWSPSAQGPQSVALPDERAAGEPIVPGETGFYWKAGPGAPLRSMDSKEVEELTNRVLRREITVNFNEWKSRTIRIYPGRQSETVDEIERALLTLDHELFQRSGRIVRAQLDIVAATGGRKTTSYRIATVDDISVLSVMGLVCRFEKFDKRERKWLPISCPDWCAAEYLKRGDWKLRHLAGTSTAPFLRSDGTIVDQLGYDEATCVLFDHFDVPFPRIPESPTLADAEGALGLLLELIEEFPFKNIDGSKSRGPSRSAALSALLTAVGRTGMATAPMHVFTAPTAGSGKSYLVDLLSTIATGYDAPVVSPGGDDEEMRKAFDAMLMKATPIILFDNVRRPLGGAWLAAAITQPRYEPRVLGKSETRALSGSSTIYGTGNNLKFHDPDMARRTIMCRMDAEMERPETRPFKRRPIEMVRTERGRYVAACLTILRAYIVAGRPQRPQPLNGFEQWSDLVRGALIWLGEADPIITQEDVRREDIVRAAAIAVFARWHKAFNSAPVTVARLIAAAAANTALNDALAGVATGKNGAITAIGLGKWLQYRKDQFFGGFRLRRVESDDAKVAEWYVELVEKRAESAPSDPDAAGDGDDSLGPDEFHS